MMHICSCLSVGDTLFTVVGILTLSCLASGYPREWGNFYPED